jgi:hypothetical protein
MGAAFIPQTVHPRAYSMICKPIGDGSLLCEPVVNDTVGGKFVTAVLILLLIAVLWMTLSVLLEHRRDRAREAKYRRELEAELAKSVSERMPK